MSPLLKSYFCFSLNFLGITSSGVQVSLIKHTQRKHESDTFETAASCVPNAMITNGLFTHWIHKSNSKGLISKVEELFLQNGLLDVFFHHLVVKNHLLQYLLHLLKTLVCNLKCAECREQWHTSKIFASTGDQHSTTVVKHIISSLLCKYPTTHSVLLMHEATYCAFHTTGHITSRYQEAGWEGLVSTKAHDFLFPPVSLKLLIQSSIFV